MSRSLEDAYRELRALRQRDRQRDLTDHIASLLKQQWSDEAAATLRSELIGECHLHSKHAQAEALIRAEIAREPKEPFHSLSLAEHFHYYDINLAESLKHIAEAVDKAQSDGKFMYQALGVQARLVIEIQDWGLLEATLRRLASYQHVTGNVDVFPETDFVARIPPGVVAEQAVAAYMNRIEYLRSIDYSTFSGALAPTLAESKEGAVIGSAALFE